MDNFQHPINEVEARFEAAYLTSNHGDTSLYQPQNQVQPPLNFRPDNSANRYLPNTQIQFSLYGYDPKGSFTPEQLRAGFTFCAQNQIQWQRPGYQITPYQSMQNYGQFQKLDFNYWDRYWSAYFGNDRPYKSQPDFQYQQRPRTDAPQRYSQDQRFSDRRNPVSIPVPVPVTDPRDNRQDQRNGSDRDQYTRRESDQGKTVIQVRPGESIQSALDKAPPGAIVRVMAGTYKERIKISRDNITLQAEQGAILDYGSTSISGAAIQISDRQNVKIEGFEIRNIRGSNTPTAIRVDGASKNISIINNDIHHVENNSNAHAIGVFGTKSSAIQNIVIAGNRVHDLKLGQSEAVVLNGNVDGFKILNNKIYNSDNIAIDIIGGEGVGRAGIDKARNGLIAGNEITNIDSRRNPTYKSACAAGIYVDGGSDVVIEDNIVKNANYGIELASERRGWKTERIQVRRNRLESNNLAGISLGGGSNSNGGVHEVTIENNHFSSNARPIWKQSNVGRVDTRNNHGA